MKNDVAIFFDLDGTLADTRADLANAVNDTREKLGLAPLAMNDVIANVGQGANYLLANSIPEFSSRLAIADSREAEEFREMFRAAYRSRMLDKAVLYPGVRDTLEILKSRGFLLGVNTAKPSFATRALLDHLAIREFFGDAIIAAGDCDEMKPSAKPLFACAEKMNHIISSRDWMVGDHWTDLQCAKNAGVKAAFCAFGFGNARDEHYDSRLEQMSDLIATVNREL